MGDKPNEDHQGENEKKRSQSDREDLSEEEIIKLLADDILISCKPLPKDANIFHSKCYKVFNLLYDKANRMKRIKHWYQCGRCEKLMKINLSKGNSPMTRHCCYLDYLEEEVTAEKQTPQTIDNGDVLVNTNKSTAETNKNKTENRNDSIESGKKINVQKTTKQITDTEQPTNVSSIKGNSTEIPIEKTTLDTANHIDANGENGKWNDPEKTKPGTLESQLNGTVDKTANNEESSSFETDIASLSIFFSKLTYFGLNHGPLSAEHIKRLMPSQFNEESWLKFYNNARKSVTNEPIDCSLSPSFRSPLISNEEVLSPPILRKEQKFGPNKREADLSVEENAKIPKKLKKKISAMDKKATKNAEKLKRDLRKPRIAKY